MFLWTREGEEVEGRFSGPDDTIRAARESAVGTTVVVYSIIGGVAHPVARVVLGPITYQTSPGYGGNETHYAVSAVEYLDDPDTARARRDADFYRRIRRAEAADDRRE